MLKTTSSSSQLLPDQLPNWKEQKLLFLSLESLQYLNLAQEVTQSPWVSVI
jgi:hypothetical protein